MLVSRLFTVLLVSFFFLATADSLEAQTITHVPLYTFHGDNRGDIFGGSVSGAGDVNGDGRPDLIVGAPHDDNNGTLSGSARVLSGIDGSVLYNFDGDSQGDFFGGSVSGAGDVNGDGRPDLIIGAPGDDNNFSDSGSARVMSGIDGSILYTVNGDSARDAFGVPVSGVGDVNGDGRADLIVGATGSGFAGGTSSVRVLSGIDGSVLYTVNGDSSDDFSGGPASGAGDVNGDGTPDLIVGGRGISNFGFSAGFVRVLSGIDGSVLHTFYGDGNHDYFGSSASGAGDVNGDGRADLIIGAPGDDENGSNSGSVHVMSGIDGSLLYTFNGDSSWDAFGDSVSGAGDVNGDGRADLIVGASGANNFTGSVYVMSGIDGSVLYTFNSEFFTDEFGASVSGAGDVNGDGLDDFIVGSPQTGSGAGYARVFVSQISGPACTLGDVDLSGVVDFADIPAFITILQGGTFQCEADCDESGVVDFADIPAFIAILQGS